MLGSAGNSEDYKTVPNCKAKTSTSQEQEEVTLSDFSKSKKSSSSTGTGSKNSSREILLGIGASAGTRGCPGGPSCVSFCTTQREEVREKDKENNTTGTWSNSQGFRPSALTAAETGSAPTVLCSAGSSNTSSPAAASTNGVTTACISSLNSTPTMQRSTSFGDVLEGHSHGEAYKMGELAMYVTNKVASGEAELKLCDEGEGGTYLVLRVPGASKKRPGSGGGLRGFPGSRTDLSSPTGSTRPIAVFKPSAEEIGCEGNPRGNNDPEANSRMGFNPGEGYLHEALASDLDYDHFASVPETSVVTLEDKVGSLQRFIPSTKQSWDMAPGRFAVSAVHRVGIFDIRTLNGDRHGGNLLVPDADPTMLVPIDHSYILPSGFADPDFEWMDWPQAKLPFSDTELQYIDGLDALKDAAIVTKVLGEECGETIAVTTRLLQVAAAAGATLHEIAHYCRRETLTQPSRLELLLAECRDDMTLEMDMGKVESLLRLHFLKSRKESDDEGSSTQAQVAELLNGAGVNRESEDDDDDAEQF